MFRIWRHPTRWILWGWGCPSCRTLFCFSHRSPTPDMVPSQMWNSAMPVTPGHFSSSQTMRPLPAKLDSLERTSNNYTDSLFSSESLNMKEGVSFQFVWCVIFSYSLLPVMNSLFYGDSHPNDAVPISVAMQHPTLLPSQLKSFEVIFFHILNVAWCTSFYLLLHASWVFAGSFLPRYSCLVTGCTRAL